MPSDTFFRLPDTKQERIMDAIREEVARVPYEKFSIGNVIAQCGISRGSFYQYFQNKEDIYLYLMAGYQNMVIDYMVESLQSNGGSMFDTLEVTFRYAVRMMCYKESKAFRHNLFTNLGLYERIWQTESYSRESRQSMAMFRHSIDRSRLNIQSEEELRALVEICFISALKDASGIFTADDDEQVVLEHFSTMLALLRKAYEIR